MKNIDTVKGYNDLKNKKGITLIALVITIIVLLILAGISIAIITGENGVLERARIAKEKIDQAQTEENSKLENYENTIDKVIEGSRESQNEGWYLLKDVNSSNEKTVYTLENGDKFSNYNEIVLVRIAKGNHITLRFSNPCKVCLDIFKTMEIESAYDSSERVIASYINDTQFYLWKASTASSDTRAYLYGIK